MSNPKIFEVEEANKMITVISPLILELKEKQRHVQSEHDQILIVDLLRGEEEIDYDSEEGKDYLKRTRQLEELIQSFQEDIIKINRLGCVLKDMERGLIDFFHVRRDELVYLCWRYGEEQIQFWHDIDGDFENRKKL